MVKPIWPCYDVVFKGVVRWVGGVGVVCIRLSVVQGHMTISGEEYDRKLITSDSLAPEDLYNVINEGTIFFFFFFFFFCNFN